MGSHGTLPHSDHCLDLSSPSFVSSLTLTAHSPTLPESPGGLMPPCPSVPVLWVRLQRQQLPPVRGGAARHKSQCSAQGDAVTHPGARNSTGAGPLHLLLPAGASPGTAVGTGHSPSTSGPPAGHGGTAPAQPQHIWPSSRAEGTWRQESRHLGEAPSSFPAPFHPTAPSCTPRSPSQLLCADNSGFVPRILV